MRPEVAIKALTNAPMFPGRYPTFLIGHNTLKALIQNLEKMQLAQLMMEKNLNSSQWVLENLLQSPMQDETTS